MDGTFRLLTAQLHHAAASFGAVVLTGPRRAGKTSLLRAAFPGAAWVLLEDPAVLAAVRADPRGFLDRMRLPVILDEVQNAPELLNHVRSRIDHDPAAKGRWLLTGSQEFGLMRGVTESMAGRAAILQLLPFSVAESPGVTLFRGGFPEVVNDPGASHLWFRSYVQSYIERDVRVVANITNISLFRRFLSVLASRTGALLNKTDIAAPLGVSVPTVTAWLDILETTGVILVVPPWFSNLGKRLLKSPRVYFADSGLACHLLGLESAEALERSPMLGPVFEGFVAAELAKHRINAARGRALHWFRDQQGLEVDFLLEGPGATPVLIEAKATHTPTPDDARGILRLRQALPERGEDYVVHRVSPSAPAPISVAPGVLALGIDELLSRLAARDL